MKTRFFLLLSLLFLTCLSAHAQSYNVTVQGTLYDLATGLPAANHPVRIEYDSTQTFFHQVTVNTNASGFYADVVAVPYPSGNIVVRSIDCGGVYRQLGAYVCSSTNNFFNGQDTICQPNPANCHAQFAFSYGANRLVNFTWQSTSGSPWVGFSNKTWDFGDGSPVSHAFSPSHTYAANGAYAVCLSILTGAGCTSTYCDTVIVGGGSGNCNAAFTSAHQGGGTYAFTNASTASAGVLAYLWNFGDGSTSTAANPTHTYASYGTYSVTLQLVANDSCMDSETNNVSWVMGCQSSFNAFSGGNPVNWTFYGNPTLPSGSYVTSWDWSFGDGSTASGNYYALHTYASTGIFPVCLTIQTNMGCVSTFCDTLVIGNGTCVAGFGYQQLANCNFVFHDSSFAPAGIASYHWDFGDGGTSTSANPSHTFQTNGLHQVCLTIVANDSCTYTHCDSIYCGSAPPCQAYYTWVHDTTGQYTILLYNQSVGGNLSYFWDFGDGATSTQQYPDHVYAGAGYYAVCLTVSDGFGCSSTFCDTLDVLFRLGVPFSINVMSPVVSVAQPQAAALAFTLYPNPAAQVVGLNITATQAGEAQVRVLDVQGRMMHAQGLGAIAAGTQQQSLALGHLPAGIYFVELRVDGQRQVQKLVLHRP